MFIINDINYFKNNCNNKRLCLYDKNINYKNIIKEQKKLYNSLIDNNVNVINIMDYIPNNFKNINNINNMIFIRDSLLFTPNGIVLAKFKEKIRNEETLLLYNFFKRIKNIKIIKEGVLEGGDYMCIPRYKKFHFFIGIGNRSNIKGVKNAMKYNIFGDSIVSVLKYNNYKDIKNMYMIHMDCYMNIIDNYIVILEKALKNVKVDEYINNKLVKKDIDLHTYLVNLGYNLIILPDSNEKNYSCNFLYVNNKVFIQNKKIGKILSQLGFDVIFVKYKEINKMYGGIHCTTNDFGLF